MDSQRPKFTRRRLLRAGAGVAAAGALGPLAGDLANVFAAPRRRPDSLPFPNLPAGEPTGAFPFDHIVILMMENHSFDNYFGMLPRSGRPRADGFRFGRHGMPLDSNPLDGGFVRVLPAQSDCQGSVGQSWNSTHEQINGGRMNGFAKNHIASMEYWTEEELPFYYSLARTFTLANRWFGSAPCQTYPNRRFLLAGTAYGLISTDLASLRDPPPPNGTIGDRLAAHGIAWKNYFVDLPATGVIPSMPRDHPASLAPAPEFFLDCATGNLPPVSFVDPEFGLLGEVGGPLAKIPLPGVPPIASRVSTIGASEENPQNIQIGQRTAASYVNAVLRSPAWPRTLLIWLYDEHGGYYDHVRPPAAIKPDSIPPKLGPDDAKGGYDIYGPRVPAVVVSPYSRPGAVTNVVHDHTSVLATIEAQWNLPACTFRDANATTLADFLDPANPAFADPPDLAAAPNPNNANCPAPEPSPPVHRR